MRLFTPLRLFSLLAALALALPTLSQARDGGGRGGGGHGGWHGGGGGWHGGHGGWHGGGGGWHGGHGGWHGGGGGWRSGYWGGGFGFYGYPYYGYPYYGYYDDPYYYGPRYAYSRPLYYGHAASDDLSVDVQRALKRRGYYGGPVDGEIGGGTRNALRHFQAEHRLEVTGRIDRPTLRALGL